jgi:ribosomal protein S18 acetylase RimI-like enzyme
MPTGAGGLIIRPAGDRDFEAMWPIFREAVAGDTYVFPPDTSREEACAYWLGPGIVSYVAEAGGQVVGMYKLIANQRGRGAHVANASFMVSPSYGGMGVGREMGWHCLREARRRGFVAMQFNFVVSTNVAAVRLWQSLGFAIVGTLPRAYAHSQRGLVDAYVMYRCLDDIPHT